MKNSQDINHSEYLTLSGSGHAEIMERGSRFIAFAEPVNDEASCKAFIQGLKTEHSSAAHVCFAWVLQEPRQHYRYYDDGEPSGSAGLPIYHCLLSAELKRSAVVVVRYFGGKKLGIPGLIKAYSESTLLAIAQAGIVKKQLKYYYDLLFPSEEIWQLYTLVQKFRLEIIEIKGADGKAEVSSGGQLFTQEEELKHLFPIFEVKFKGCY